MRLSLSAGPVSMPVRCIERVQNACICVQSTCAAGESTTAVPACAPPEADAFGAASCGLEQAASKPEANTHQTIRRTNFFTEAPPWLHETGRAERNSIRRLSMPSAQSSYPGPITGIRLTTRIADAPPDLDTRYMARDA
ncbi:hypothetical protein GCM10027285_08390 [Oleiagrimonas citrea]